jgi:hypothetical protein
MLGVYVCLYVHSDPSRVFESMWLPHRPLLFWQPTQLKGADSLP